MKPSQAINHVNMELLSDVPETMIAVVEHSIKAEHRIHFRGTTVLARMMDYMGCLVKVTEIWLHLDDFNGVIGFPLYCSWYTAMIIINHMSEPKKPS